MQNKPNLSTYSNDNPESETKSPTKKPSGEQKRDSFKSPLTSAKKGRISRNLTNNENDPEHNNPFSGPIFAPNTTFSKSKSSPAPKTPLKLKEEFFNSDLVARDLNLGIRVSESPFSRFCKDLTVSPAKPNLMSPSIFHPGLQYNHSFGNIPSNHYGYSPLHEKESPAFKRNITKLEFNPSNNVILNSHKDRVNIESEDLDSFQLHNAHLYDDAGAQSYFQFFSNPASVYANTMIPNENYNKRLFEEIPEKPEAGERQLPPRTPSPQAHMKLETINSFSAQRNNYTAKRENTPMENNDSVSQESGRRVGGVREVPSSAKAKKVCCNCKKSRCLKLYCDCFGRGETCSKECNCVNCYNDGQHEKERLEAIQSIQEKNPSAFKPKIDQTDSPKKEVIKAEENAQGRVRHMRGCNCKKSGCLKKYCECYQAGIQCTEMCKCENCKNMDACTRHKRAEKYKLQNFGGHPLMEYPREIVVYQRKDYDEYEDPRYASHAQTRISDKYRFEDQSYYSELPTKKRKNEASVYEFTPKKTLIFTKEEEENESEVGERGYNNFATPHANMDKKRSVKIEPIEDYTPSPGKFNHSGKRAKRNVKLFSQFNPEEYELTK